MTSLLRKTLNFDGADAEVVAAFLDDESDELRRLEQDVGRRLPSESSRLRALAILGARQVRERLITSAYDAAYEAGEFEDTNRWLRASADMRRRQRPPE